MADQHQLSPDSVQDFLDRYESFDDAVLLSFHHQLDPTSGLHSVQLQFSAYDVIQRSMSIVCLDMMDVAETVFTMRGHAYVRIITGLTFAWIDGLIWLAVNAGDVSLTKDQISASDTYIAAHECSWSGTVKSSVG
jgi:hypothetical protein